VGQQGVVVVSEGLCRSSPASRSACLSHMPLLICTPLSHGRPPTQPPTHQPPSSTMPAVTVRADGANTNNNNTQHAAAPTKLINRQQHQAPISAVAPAFVPCAYLHRLCGVDPINVTRKKSDTTRMSDNSSRPSQTSGFNYHQTLKFIGSRLRHDRFMFECASGQGIE
jgi:hypothetical protein